MFNRCLDNSKKLLDEEARVAVSAVPLAVNGKNMKLAICVLAVLLCDLATTVLGVAALEFAGVKVDMPAIATGCTRWLDKTVLTPIGLHWIAQPSGKSGQAPGSGGDGYTATEKHEVVGAIGRLEPFGEVIKLGLPGFLHDERVDQVFVREGDPVEKGQLICSLDSKRRLQASLDVAGRNLKLAEARLASVKAGAKRGEIDAQAYRIESIEADRKESLGARKAMLTALIAQQEFALRERNRFEALFKDGAISASQLEDKRAQLALASGRVLECRAELNKVNETLDAQQLAAQAELERIKEVRPQDVLIALSEVEAARAEVKKIECDLSMASIYSPVSGRVLKVNVRSGEVPARNGLVELGRTEAMVAVAEVYQTDIAGIKVGQSATICGDGFYGTVSGVVRSLGWKVVPQRITTDSPDSPNDRRVVEVKILIDEDGSRVVRNLTDMEVEVLIDTGANSKTAR